MQALSHSAPGASSAQAKAQQRQQPMRLASMHVSTAASSCSPRRPHAATAAASPSATGASALRASAVQRRQQQHLQQRQQQPLAPSAGPPHCRGRPAAAVRRSVAASASATSGGKSDVAPGSVSVVLLAGGVGKRMGANIPKQYLKLRGLEIAAYSLQTFVGMPEVGEVVVVCDPSWRDVFERALEGGCSMPIKWALPGKERQDSVFNGLQEIQADAALVAVHDSARPLVTAADALKCFKDAAEVGAAVLGAPCKPTIKEVDASNIVVKTLKRSDLWEVFTPQVIQPQLLRDGFALVRAEKLEVTDDVSIIEAMGRPVRVTPGAYTNIKVTTPDDLLVAEKFLDELQAAEAVRA